MNQGMRDEIKKLVEKAEEREKKARPGPWWVSGDFVRAHAPNTDAPALIDIADGMLDEDAQFIAHARQDVPALCAEVRRLDAELKRFQIIAGTMTGYLQSLGFEVVTEQDGMVSIAPVTPDAIAR